MIRSAVLALALCAAAGAASAQQLPQDLGQAQMLCMAHMTGMCTSNPPIPCHWESGWEESCSEIEQRVRKMDGTEQKKRERAEHERRSLDFVRGVAGMKEGGR